MFSVGMLGVRLCMGEHWPRAPGGAISPPAVAGKGCLAREQFGNQWGWFAPAEVCTDLSEGWRCHGCGHLSHPSPMVY